MATYTRRIQNKWEISGAGAARLYIDARFYSATDNYIQYPGWQVGAIVTSFAASATYIDAPVAAPPVPAQTARIYPAPLLANDAGVYRLRYAPPTWQAPPVYDLSGYLDATYRPACDMFLQSRTMDSWEITEIIEPTPGLILRAVAGTQNDGAAVAVGSTAFRFRLGGAYRYYTPHAAGVDALGLVAQIRGLYLDAVRGQSFYLSAFPVQGTTAGPRYEDFRTSLTVNNYVTFS